MTGTKRLIMLSLPAPDGKGKRFGTLLRDIGNLARSEGRELPGWELIERDLIYRLLGDVIQGAWEGTSDKTGIGIWLQGTRDAYDRPNLWRHYENLYLDYLKWIKDNPV